jgi:hypothetical protein
MPILRATSKAFTKLALKSFGLILSYTKTASPKKPDSSPVIKLIKLCAGSQELRDEVFFQLIKQTVKNRNEAICAKTWVLLLIIATAVPATPARQHEIKRQLAMHATGPNKAVARLAKWVFCRFCSRCELGTMLNPVPPALLASVPREPYESTTVFGVSIHEQLLTQERLYQKLPIPHILPLLCRAIVDKGGLRHEGIFRRSGELVVVNRIAQSLDKGEDLARVLEAPDCRINELTQVLKLWFAKLPQRVVFGEYCERLREAFRTTKNYIAVVEQLPKAHLYVLKYLLGLLQQVTKADALTKMNPDNIGIVFGPTLVAPPPADDIVAISTQINLWRDPIRTGPD